MRADAGGEIVIDVRVGWLDAIQDQFGSAPWWLVSILVHSAFLLLAMVWVVAIEKPEPQMQFVVRPLIPEKPPEPPAPDDPPVREEPPEIEMNLEITREVANPFNEEFEQIDLDVRPGVEGTGEEGLLDLVGPPYIGVSGPSGGPPGAKIRSEGPYGERDVRAVEPPIQPHILWALDWLARHQEPDGRWDGEKYEGEDTDAGISGLAVLAFLGAGMTERSGKYKATMIRAFDWIISQQDDDGCIGRSSTRGGLGYHHAICGMVLAQEYAMARTARTGIAAQKAVDYSVNVHQVPYSAWRYNARQEPDLSVTGWFIMQLKSAKVAGLKVPGEGFQGAINFLDKVTDQQNYPGRAGYQTKEQANRTLTAVGLTARIFMGWKPDDPLLKGAAEYIMEALPEWGRDQGEGVNFYYWYYASLSMFQMGPAYWARWNAAMKNALLPTQRTDGDAKGSWDPVGRWSERGGRVYSTALGALCLETPMTYNPLYY